MILQGRENFLSNSILGLKYYFKFFLKSCLVIFVSKIYFLALPFQHNLMKKAETSAILSLNYSKAELTESAINANIAFYFITWQNFFYQYKKDNFQHI